MRSKLRRTRLAVFGALSIAASALLATVNPQAAHAGVPPPIYFTYAYTIVSATSNFFPTDGRVVINNTDIPAHQTVTATKSQKIAVTVTVGTTATLVEKLQQTVNVQIVSEQTSSIGVSVDIAVPPRTSILAEYGVQGYNVVYDVQTTRCVVTNCTVIGIQRGTTVAPINVEGWRLSTV